MTAAADPRHPYSPMRTTAVALVSDVIIVRASSLHRAAAPGGLAGDRPVPNVEMIMIGRSDSNGGQVSQSSTHSTAVVALRRLVRRPGRDG